MLKRYLLVTKPGIIFGNLISVVGGFFLASKGDLQLDIFLATLAGVSLVIASGCVFNNYIDRDIDCLMERTRNRVLVQGLIGPRTTLVYATALGVTGVGVALLGESVIGGARWFGLRGVCRFVHFVAQAPFSLWNPGRQFVRCHATGDRLLCGQ
jgi:protoheme IX farnesyltransferase